MWVQDAPSSFKGSLREKKMQMDGCKRSIRAFIDASLRVHEECMDERDMLRRELDHVEDLVRYPFQRLKCMEGEGMN
jgi:hypothetical protein